MDHFKNDVLIYLASPYSHPNQEVRNTRHKEAEEATAFLLKSKFMVFAPIVYGHEMAVSNDLPKEFDFWMQLDLRILRGCDVLCILTIDGWKKSKGVRAEFEYAQALGKTIWTLDIPGVIGVLRSSPQWEQP